MFTYPIGFFRDEVFNPKDITGPLKELTGFGWKFVQKNKEILFGKNLKNPQKKLDEI